MPARDGRFDGIDCAADIVTSRRGIPVATPGDFASFAVLHKEFTGGERSHIVLGRKIS
jgi:hypothetical protein